MGTADTTRIGIDGYRVQVLERLKNCGDAEKARDILAEVDVALHALELSARAQRAFWEGLDTDLDVVAEEWTHLLGREPAATLDAIIAVAKGDIAQYILIVSS
jgi:hypothetical protein